MTKLKCPHFGFCGGCSFLDTAYSEQLNKKESLLKDLIAPFCSQEINKILPSPQIYYYRNKMEFAFGPDKNEHLSLGLRKKGSFFNVVDIKNCLLLSQSGNHILQSVRDWAKDKNIAPYNSKKHQGILRYLVVREGKKTDNLLLNLITTSELKKELVLEVVEKIKFRFPLLTTFIWSRYDGKSDVAQADVSETLYGPGYIEDLIGNVHFKISPFSFFQTNTLGTYQLYEIIKKLIRESCPDAKSVLDLYCGTGGISLYIASVSKKVLGVESNKEAVNDAKENALKNNINNATFMCEKIENITSSLIEKQETSIGIIDPPRSGLHPKALKYILSLNLPFIIYVSCNPKVLANDLKSLIQTYTITYVQPIDLFPHTPHLETVLMLKKQ
ncbi:MAG: 23S rRNA (uracil(1939)-C(5))-methyltransferase RlmD [Endomicrobiales bacterium]|nr:23S rRNA (uracil(1939)-C(5))-methyltransferase RlmD [Endomicrobiales bacterium]